MANKDLSILTESVNQELVNLSNWIKANRLILNQSKTHYLISHSSSRIPNIDVELDNQIIKRVEEAKFLGVILDSRLMWKSHINEIKVKLSKVSGMLYKVRDYMNLDNLKQLYLSLAYPHILYCSAVWSGASKTSLHSLELAQKRLIRIMSYKAYNDHTSQIFKELSLLKLKDIFFLQTSLFVYKSVNCLIPSENDFHVIRHSFNTRGVHETLRLPQCRTCHAQQSLIYRGSKIRNSIDESIRRIPSINSFKLALKNTYVVTTSLELFFF